MDSAAAVTGLQAEVDHSRSGNSSYRSLFIAHKCEAALFLEADLAVHALCVLDPGSHELGRQRDLPEANPVNKADSRVSQMRAVTSASRTLASPSTYGQSDSAEHPSAGQGGQPSPRTQLTPGSPAPPLCLLRLHNTAPEMGG